MKRNTGQTLQADFALAYWADLRYDWSLDISRMDERYKPERGGDPFRRYVGSWTDALGDIRDKYGDRLLDKEKDLIGLGSNVELLLSVTLTLGFSDRLAYRQSRRAFGRQEHFTTSS